MTASGAHLRHRRIYRVAPRINGFVKRHNLAGGARSPLALVRHVGRRSGRVYATPVAVHRQGRLFFVPLTYGPAADWCRNVLAAGTCSMRLHGAELRLVEPRLVAREQLVSRWQVFYRLTGHREFLRLRVQ